MKSTKELIEWLENIHLSEWVELSGADEWRDIRNYLGAFEQIKWERDVAIQQLHDLGYDLGQKTDMQKIYDDIYPLTVVMDRYNGTYSGGVFTAWNLDFDEVPWQICSSDTTTWDIFDDIKNGCRNIVYGVGNTPDLAVKDLWNKLNSKN